MPTVLKANEIGAKLNEIPGWERQDQKICRHYVFSGFIPAMAFVNHVADLAERMNHHPDILIHYNKVTLTLSTHSAGGLTALDFELAKKIDA